MAGMTEEVKKKLSVAIKKKWQDPVYRRKTLAAMQRRPKPSLETRKKMSLTRTGMKQSEETCRRRSQTLKGHSVSQDTREKISKSLKELYEGGYKRPKDCLEEQSRQMGGSKNPNWRGGITDSNKRIRESKEYKKWRKKVFERDNYTCVNCGQVGGKLNADHIKPFSRFPKLRFEVDNGRTLCERCHRKIGWNLFKTKDNPNNYRFPK